MGAATRITCTEHTADELLDLARDCRDAKQAARARAVAMIMDVDRRGRLTPYRG